MATDAFSAYQREYLALRASVQDKLDNHVPTLRGEERKAAIRRVNMELDELDEIIDQLELEGKGKAKLMAQVRAYRQESKSWKSKATSLASVSDRDLLLSSRPAHSSYPLADDDEDEDGDTDTLSYSAAQRARLLQSTQKLDTTSSRLENSHRLALENEQIGQEVLGSLVGQRMQLQNANEHLDEADVSIGRASGTITKMIRLGYRQRFMLGGFVLVFAVLIALILWRKLR
ncbi:hypothetical protein JCM3774_002544 [Rhodotorula dairenensis]